MQIGFIGLGVQGRPLAENLIDAGYSVHVCDLRAEPVAELAAKGATAAGSLREVASRCEIVQICVLDDRQLRSVMLAEDGVVSGLSRGMVVVVHSTVSPRLIADLHPIVAKAGAELLDAPVSGGERGARARTMSYMVGGDAEAVERCRPLFETSGRSIIHTGPVGTGVKTKLAHQIVLAVNMLAASEGFRLGLAAGIPEQILSKAFLQGAAQSGAADRWPQRMMQSEVIPALYKDLALAIGLARELGISAPGAALAQQSIDEIAPVAQPKDAGDG